MPQGESCPVAMRGVNSSSALHPPRPQGNVFPPEVTFIVVTYNSAQTIARCIAALRAPDGRIAGRLVVVDNASTDGSANLVTAAYPDALVLRNQRNLGFAAAANRGLGTVRTPFAILLNPDTLLAAAQAQELVRRLAATRDVGIAACRLVEPAGNEHASFSFRYPGERGAAVARSARGGPALDVAYVYGALMAVRMEAVRQVGALDEDFFMYYEDADWCRRMRRAGWRVVVFTDLAVIHIGGASSQGVSAAAAAARYFRSELLFHRKHHPGARYLWIAGKRSLATILRLGLLSLACALTAEPRLWRKWLKYRARLGVVLDQVLRRGQPR